MSILAKMFRDTISSYKDIGMKNEKVADVGYSTGFPNFDMRNACLVHVHNEEKGLNYNYYQIGITDGSITTVIGRSGCGKSTFCLQVAANIIRPFKTSCIYSDEIESGMQDSRKEVLTKFSGDELKNRLISRNTGITSENFFERIKLIHDIRIAHYDEFEYNTGYKDYKGDDIYKLEPCCYIMDSWALLRPKGLTEEETISGQMSVTSSAKMNTEILRRIVPMLKNANINLFIINHILKEVNINPYAKVTKQVQYLDEGERCPGGDTPMYLANTLIKLYDSPMKSEMFDVDGSIVVCNFKKSRTNKAGKETYLVYNQAIGYDPELSLYVTLHKAKLVTNAGSWMYFVGHPEQKFQQKKLKDKLRNEPEFRKLFMEIAMQYLSQMVDSEMEEEKYEQEVATNIVSDFYNMINYKQAA